MNKKNENKMNFKDFSKFFEKEEKPFDDKKWNEDRIKIVKYFEDNPEELTKNIKIIQDNLESDGYFPKEFHDFVDDLFKVGEFNYKDSIMDFIFSSVFNEEYWKKQVYEMKVPVFLQENLEKSFNFYEPQVLEVIKKHKNDSKIMELLFIDLVDCMADEVLISCELNILSQYFEWFINSVYVFLTEKHGIKNLLTYSELSEKYKNKHNIASKKSNR